MFIFNFTCCKYFALKENHYSKQTNHPLCFPHGEIGMSKKILLNRFKSFAIKSFISSPSNSNFQLIILCSLLVELQSFLLYHISNFRLYVHISHANLTNQCLLNVAFCMKKVVNIWSYPKQNFHSLPPSNAISKTFLLLLLVFLFLTLHFLFQTLWNLNWLHSKWDFVAYGVIKYNGFQISGNKSYETP